jgi:hypothetical protein
MALVRAGITGVASVIDGDTIEIHGQRIRLHGIAPESCSLMSAVKLLGSGMGFQQAPKWVGGWRSSWRAAGFETAVEQALMRGLVTA